MKKLLLVIFLFVSANSFAAQAIFNNYSKISLNIADPSFRLACAMGKVEGCSVVRKFAINPDLRSDTKRDVWDFGAGSGGVDYTYPADGTAPINTISSSSALDLQTVAVIGLDINGKETEQLITLNGQNKVTLPIPLWRSYRMANLQVTGTADRSLGLNGAVYLYEDTAISGGIPTDITKVRAYMFNGNNQTQMTHFTIPADTIGFFIAGTAKIARRQATACVYELWARDFGTVFRLVDTNALNSQGTSAFVENLFVPAVISAKTDLVFAATSDANGAGIAISYTIILLDMKVFGL